MRANSWTVRLHSMSSHRNSDINHLASGQYCKQAQRHTPSHIDILNGQHFNDVIIGAIASLITSLTIVYTIVYPDADLGKHQSSASLAFVWGIHRGPVNFPHKGPVTRKMIPFDDVIMKREHYSYLCWIDLLWLILSTMGDPLNLTFRRGYICFIPI